MLMVERRRWTTCVRRERVLWLWRRRKRWRSCVQRPALNSMLTMKKLRRMRTRSLMRGMRMRMSNLSISTPSPNRTIDTQAFPIHPPAPVHHPPLLPLLHSSEILNVSQFCKHPQLIQHATSNPPREFISPLPQVLFAARSSFQSHQVFPAPSPNPPHFPAFNLVMLPSRPPLQVSPPP